MTTADGGRPETTHDTWLVRHGETEWARLGRHTGRTDVPLTDVGRDQARALGRRLADHPFTLVLTSPLSRAAETTALAGYPSAEVDPNLREWDYGDLEGRLTADIRADFRAGRSGAGHGPAARPSTRSLPARTGS